MKFFINRHNDSITGGYREKDLVGLAVDGMMPIDIPYDDFFFNLKNDLSSPTVSDLFLEKYNKIDSEVKKVFSFTDSIYHEFYDFAFPVSALSSKYSKGDRHRTVIFPSGVFTMLIPTTHIFTGVETNLYCYYNAYRVAPQPNNINFGPPKMEYVSTFDPTTDITFNILDNVGAFIQTVSPGFSLSALGGYVGTFHVSLVNNTPNPLILSDFCLYWK